MNLLQRLLNRCSRQILHRLVVREHLKVLQLFRPHNRLQAHLYLQSLASYPTIRLYYNLPDLEAHPSLLARWRYSDHATSPR